MYEELSLWVHTWSAKWTWCFMALSKPDDPSASCSIFSPGLRIVPHESLAQTPLKSDKMYRFIVSFQPGQGLSSRREVVLVFWNVRWFGQHKLNTSCPKPVNKSDDGTINAGFETDKRLFLICYCYTVFSSVNFSPIQDENQFTQICLILLHRFLFFYQCRGEMSSDSLM